MSNSHARRALFALSLTLAFAGAARAQSTQEMTGFARLAERLGPGNYPTGLGVILGQVEAPADGEYAPDAGHPELGAKAIAYRSGFSGGASWHATAVAQYGFGAQTSIAPGISTIQAFEANHWIGSGFLNGPGSLPPSIAGVRIFNHSWIGSAGAANNMLLRKLDAAIEAQGLLMCAGVNNGNGPLDVALLSHSFHAIAVGRSDGSHRAGATALDIDGPGRMKPELVAPANATSFATPLVSGAAALLIETASREPRLAGNPHAAQPEVVKAVLMAGALHRAGWSNGPVLSGSLRGATATPLDPIFGADQLDVDTSHWILAAGEQPAAPSAALAPACAPAGWSLIDIGSGQSLWLRFQVEARKPFVSIVAAWDRSVAPGYASWALADLDLELWSVDAQGAPAALLGAPRGSFFQAGNVLSDSAVDNVEHLYVYGLEPGEYLLELRRAQDGLTPVRAAIAWHFASPQPQAYGASQPTSLGTRPALRSSGMASQFGDDFELALDAGVPHASCWVLQGSGRANLPFGGASLLVAPPIQRLPAGQLDASGSMRLQISITPEMVGTTRHYQCLFLDPRHPGRGGFGLSNALEVAFGR